MQHQIASSQFGIVLRMLVRSPEIPSFLKQIELVLVHMAFASYYMY